MGRGSNCTRSFTLGFPFNLQRDERGFFPFPACFLICPCAPRRDARSYRGGSFTLAFPLSLVSRRDARSNRISLAFPCGSSSCFLCWLTFRFGASFWLLLLLARPDPFPGCFLTRPCAPRRDTSSNRIRSFALAFPFAFGLAAPIFAFATCLHSGSEE